MALRRWRGTRRNELGRRIHVDVHTCNAGGHRDGLRGGTRLHGCDGLRGRTRLHGRDRLRGRKRLCRRKGHRRREPVRRRIRVPERRAECRGGQREQRQAQIHGEVGGGFVPLLD